MFLSLICALGRDPETEFEEISGDVREAGFDLRSGRRRRWLLGKWAGIKIEEMPTAIGIDFGTTNSSIAYANDAGEVTLAQFPQLGEVTAAYRSLLYLEQVKERGVNALKSWSGPEGIAHYLSADHKGRLIQSLKSFLSNRNLLSTEVFGRRHTLEDLIARILRDLREKASAQFSAPILKAVVDRPVRFGEPRTRKTIAMRKAVSERPSRWPGMRPCTSNLSR